MYAGICLSAARRQITAIDPDDLYMVNGFTTAFAVLLLVTLTALHLVTLTIKDGSLHESDHLVVT